jgi:hypothetical protein
MSPCSCEGPEQGETKKRTPGQQNSDNCRLVLTNAKAMPERDCGYQRAVF